jgi:ribosomal-protein-serine acetyltransferase
VTKEPRVIEEYPDEVPTGGQLLLLVDDHVVLRQLVPEDARALFRLVDGDRQRLRRTLPWVDGTRGVDDTIAFLRTSVEEAEDGEGWQLGIFVDGELCGVVGHHSLSWLHARVNLGYWLAAEHEGRGLMTRACTTVIDHAFSQLSMQRVEICAAIDNVRSRAVAERLGLVQEGVRRQAEKIGERFVDLVVYGVLAHEWKARR